jgi:hypothetical protein
MRMSLLILWCFPDRYLDILFARSALFRICTVACCMLGVGGRALRVCRLPPAFFALMGDMPGEIMSLKRDVDFGVSRDS